MISSGGKDGGAALAGGSGAGKFEVSGGLIGPVPCARREDAPAASSTANAQNPLTCTERRFIWSASVSSGVGSAWSPPRPMMQSAGILQHASQDIECPTGPI